MLQRYGFYRTPALAGDVVWIHAVSVGETRAAATLVAQARRRAPDATILADVDDGDRSRDRAHAVRPDASSRRGFRTTCPARCAGFSRTSVRRSAS